MWLLAGGGMHYVAVYSCVANVQALRRANIISVTSRKWSACVWWYQNFAYICRASEAVASARGYVTRPSRHHCAWVTFRAGRLRLPCSFSRV
nr:MAG TPA: hypothetical protein [Caudoviricetes sp.]